MKARVFWVGVRACVFFLLASVVHADTHWTGGVGDWSSESNWDNGVPGHFGTAYINNGGTALLTVPYEESFSGVFLGENAGDSGTLVVAGGYLSSGSFRSSYVIGNAGNGTLNILNGGVVGAGGHGFGGFSSNHIGYLAGSMGQVTVDGLGSTWTMNNGLDVGFIGSGMLNISNGGTVSSDSSDIGRSVGSTGVVTVDGPGSTWTSRFLNVGVFGNGTLNISNGGNVIGELGSVGVRSEPGSSGLVHVDGAGSMWTVSRLGIGYSGNGTLNITNGGTVDGNNCQLGAYSGSTGLGSTGLIHVDGLGSTLTISGRLMVGDFGSGTLNITNGGTVSSNNSWIGSYFRSGSSGLVHVDGTGSTWTNNGSLSIGHKGNSTLNITNGGEVTVGVDTQIVHNSDSSGTIHFHNGTLTTGGLLCVTDDLTGTGTIHTHGLVSDVELVFDAAHGVNQTIHFNDNPGQNLTVHLDIDGSAPMGAGYSGAGTMAISDGVRVRSTYGYIGYESGSTGQVTVEGVGSAWANSDKLYVGRSGHGTLNITAGGSVDNTNGYVGYNSGTTGQVTVEGIGSTWTNRDELYIGHGDNGTLTILDGGTVSSNGGYISGGSDLPGQVTVEGVGSKWVNSGKLFVGTQHHQGGNSILNITQGGAVISSGAEISGFNGSSALVNINGIGSTWTNNGDFRIAWGTGTLNISNGGVARCSNAYVGTPSVSVAILVAVDGIGSTWTSSGELDISAGTLSITNGGAASCDSTHIGSSFSPALVAVDGIGSTWTSNGELYLSAGTLSITNGGAVRSGEGNLNATPFSTDILVNVDGIGSTWANGGDFRMDTYYNDNNTLRIVNGGTVSNNNAFISGGRYFSSAMLLVDGANSTWTNNGYLAVGIDHRAALRITEGGIVTSNGSIIGAEPGSGGQVTVDGLGSRWANNGILDVGCYGQGILSITNGGLVSVALRMTIGDHAFLDSFVNMSTGGTLALFGEADDSLADFLDQIYGADGIQYWDGSTWDNITNAIEGVDYTLDYLATGDLTGYTLLTVGTVPEPSTLALGALALIALAARRRNGRG